MRIEKFIFQKETYLAFNDLHLDDDGDHFYRTAIKVGDAVDRDGFLPMYALSFKATLISGCDGCCEDDYDCDLEVEEVDEVGRAEPAPGWQHYISNGTVSCG